MPYYKKITHFINNPTKIASIFITILIMTLATAISFFFYHFMPLSEDIVSYVLLYILAILLIARFTCGYIYPIIASLLSVILVNYLFTYPFWAFNFTITGYPIMFIGMFTIAVIISTMTTQLKKQSAIITEREKLLMEAEKEKMRANLLRAISHDLRTPLTGIIGNSSTYLDNIEYISSKEKADIVANIYNDSNWLLNMVENLLSVTRIHGENMNVVTSLESVEEVVSEAVIRLKKRYPDSAVIATVPDELIMAPMDAVLIEQVIINLLENAIVHANSREPIECTVVDDSKNVVFIIKDYGIGIDRHKLPYIFDGNVYETASSADAHKGMGIGLSICKTIITAHQGKISARNHEHGAEFIFNLPKE